MGWSNTWNSWFGAKTDDPLSKLDPEVRKFLERESPAKLDSAQREQEAAGAEQAAAEEAQYQAQAAAARARAADPNAAPPESLFPDGRYAHLWKTYRSRGAIESESKTDEEKLQDVLDAFKARKSSIGQIALENCALEQMAWSDCMRNGSVATRFLMCRDEVRKFETCHKMQTKLLKALGYLTAVNDTPETDEKIQLHADKLYHEMMEQQEAIAQAKKENMPEPAFKPILPKQTMEDEALLSDDGKKKLAEKMEGMTAHEREAEKAAADAEVRARVEMVEQIQNIRKKEASDRQTRIDEGKATTWDRLKTAFHPADSPNEKKK